MGIPQWKDLVCNPDTVVIFKNLRMNYADTTLTINILCVRFGGLSISHHRMKINTGSVVTWRNLGQQIREELEIEGKAESRSSIYVIGPGIPAEETLVYIATADPDWPLGTLIRKQFIDQEITPSDDPATWSIYRLVDPSNRSWRVLIIFDNPRDRISRNHALNMLREMPIHLSARNTRSGT
jgi:hypothetical protein